MEKLNFTLTNFVTIFILLFVHTAYAQQLQIIPASPEQALSETPSQRGELFNPEIQPSALPPEVRQKFEEIQQPPKLDQPSDPDQPAPPGTGDEKAAEIPGPAMEAEQELSEFEQFVSGTIHSTISTSIKQFGYGLFGQPASTFAPSGKVPVGPGYVIGPGDEIRIIVWGKIEAIWRVVVDRDGTISLPKMGVIGVTGLTFGELKTFLHKEMSKYYTGFEMNVSMGALRSIRVYIVGNAVKPGAYTISSLSTLLNALFAAGGPGKTGTMRNIQVKRNGHTIVSFDMYDFLLKGDKTKDIRLLPEDVIFIPPVGKLAGIAGHVMVPAIYELKEDTTMTGLIAMAGGVTATGYLQRVQVERIHNNEVKILVDTNLKEFDKKADIILQDWDIIKVFPISNVITNAVVVKGNITRPGQFQWTEGMRVSDIIDNPAFDLLPETHYEHALIERYIPPDYHKEIISINLGRVLFDRDKGENKLLMPYDTLTIYSTWDFRERPFIQVAGAVNKPGLYGLRPNMRISDLVNLAGGLKRYAFVKEAELTRLNITQEGPETEKILINIESALKLSPDSNILLKEDDFLNIRTIPEWQLYKLVSIAGEVKFPGSYTVKKGEQLSSLLERAGGYTDEAYLRGAVFTRNSVRELQQKSIDDMILRLESRLLVEGSLTVSAAASKEELESKKVEIEQKKKFIETLKKLKATGRMTINLTHLRLLKGSEYDIGLEDGDSLLIPMQNSVINVDGAVISKGTYIYSGKLEYKDYIGMAGGYSEFADEDNIYILKVDGSARKLDDGFFNWNRSQSRWEMTSFTEEVKTLEPGDTIVVPEKLERIAWMREIKDITQIMYQIAVTAGVLIVAF
jgi:protein involved in polysaccharide export with SLBB domain